VDRLGPAENIRYGRLPDPTPATGELLVRVLATAVNPVDTYVRSGSYRTAVPMPFVVGRDVVGDVLVAGPGVRQFSIGERVWSNSLGYDGRQGAAATLAIVPVDRTVRLPRSVDPVRAAAASHPGSTAATALLHHARLAAGETLLVFGANGSVGSAAVQIGRECGARVVAVVRRPEAVAAGPAADLTLDSSRHDVAAALRRLAPGGADVVWDTAGHQPLATAVELAALRGRVLLTAGGSRQEMLPVGPFYTRNVALLGFVMSRASVAELTESAALVGGMLAAGTLSVRPPEVLPLSAAADAHRRVEDALAGRHRLEHRLVLVPDGE